MYASIRTIGLGLAPVALGVVLGLAPLAALAEDAPSTHTAMMTKSQIFDITFPGGPLSSFAEQLQSQDANANIFVQTDAVDFPVPAMSMRQVDVTACVWMLDLLRTQTKNGRHREIVTDIYNVPGGSRLIVLSNLESGPARSTPSTRSTNGQSRPRRVTNSEPASTIRIDTMSVGDLLASGFTKDMILNDIRTLQALEGEQDNPAKAIIEEGSGIIMVKGNSHQINQIWELLAAMDDSTYYREVVLTDAAKQAKAEPSQAVALRLLTEAQLAEMSQKELRDRMVKISQLRKEARGNDEYQKQLTDQFTLTMTALKSMNDVD